MARQQAHSDFYWRRVMEALARTVMGKRRIAADEDEHEGGTTRRKQSCRDKKGHEQWEHSQKEENEGKTAKEQLHRHHQGPHH